jgi:general secretion pathway protein K
MTRPPRHAPRRTQRGAALLIAMIILTLVATLASGMVWQQWRAIQVEGAERGRTQSAWILNGALDWARLILREDSRTGGPDHLGEPWAVPLAEARLSTFLAADRDNTADSGPEAFLAGSIADAQSRYNLRNLVDAAGKLVPAEQQALQRLCSALGLPTDTADLIGKALQAAWSGADPTAAIAPRRTSDLAWLGLDADTLERLRAAVEVLPVPTPVNLNTASREVIVAAVAGVDLGTAERLVQGRQRQHLKTLDDARAYIAATIPLDPKQVSVSSNFFDIRGRMRLNDRVLEERSLVERRGLDIVTLLRERNSQVLREAR